MKPPTTRARRLIQKILTLAVIALLLQPLAFANPERQAGQNERNLQEAKKLNDEVVRLYQGGKYQEAISLAERALAILEKLLGPDHPEVANLVHSLAAIYKVKGNYVQSEQLHKSALAIREKALGANHSDVGKSLNSLGGLYRVMGEYGLAEQMYTKALAIFEKVVGSENTTIATLLDNLGLVYQEKRNYVLAEQTHRRALDIFERFLGPDHLDVAIALDNLAGLYQRTGDYARAEQMYQRSLEISKKRLGPDHPAVAIGLDNFAGLYQKKLDYARAEQMRRRALEILAKNFGPDHPEVAIALSNLAVLYSERGDYVQAEQMHQRARTIFEKAFGANHPEVASTLNSIASVHTLKGDYVSAALTYRRALEIWMKPHEPDNLGIVSSLDGLAYIYHKLGEYDLAESIYKRALAILVKVYGVDNPKVESSLDDLAGLYFERGDYVQAERLFLRSLAGRVKLYGEDHPGVAIGLSHLAELYHVRGDYIRAEQMYRRARAIYEKTFGPDHPNVAGSLFQLAVLEWARGDMAQAISLLTRANESSEHNLALILPTGSERQKSSYLIASSHKTYATISLHVHSAPHNSEAARIALTIILQRKGRALEAMTDQVGALRRRLNPQDRALFDELSAKRAQLAALTLKGAGETDPKRHRAQVLALDDEVERLEAQGGAGSIGFRAQSQPVTLERVQQSIPAGAALVELVSYSPYNPKGSPPDRLYGATRYVAYVLRRGGEPTFVDLGEAAPIESRVTQLRKALADPKSTGLKQAARALDELVMRPVRKLLGETRMVLLSPDDALNLVPFSALVDEQGRYLVEKYTITYLTSGRDLLRFKEKIQSNRPAMVIADPDFGEANKAGDAATTSASSKGTLSDLYFSRLVETEQEAKELKTLFPQAEVLTREKATEAALKSASSPRILHIATHGFFLDDLAQVQTGDGKGPIRIVRVKPASKKIADEKDIAKLINPLLRSGLGLAGANLGTGKDGNDGVLTALEATGLDLWGTKLVVLSACDTGVGEVKNGDGVYGLRRALVLAGSESQVMSLWPVSDAGTRDLMIDYYKRLKTGQGRGEALRQAQLRMLKNPARRHPFYWASFIQSGEWANLDGKRID